MLLLYSMYSFYLPFWIQLKPSWCIALTAYCQSRPESCAVEEETVLGLFWESVLMALPVRLFCRARAEEQYALSKTRARRAQCYMFRREPDVSGPAPDLYR